MKLRYVRCLATAPAAMLAILQGFPVAFMRLNVRGRWEPRFFSAFLRLAWLLVWCIAASHGQSVLTFDHANVTLQSRPDPNCERTDPDPHPVPDLFVITGTSAREISFPFHETCTLNGVTQTINGTAIYTLPPTEFVYTGDGFSSVRTRLDIVNLKGQPVQPAHNEIDLDGCLHYDMDGATLFFDGSPGSAQCDTTAVGIETTTGLFYVSGTFFINFGQRQLGYQITVYYKESPCTIAVPGCSGETPRAWVQHIEVVQAVQVDTSPLIPKPEDLVPMVARKPAVVRVFLKATQTIDDVTGVLHVMRNNSEVAVVEPTPVAAPSSGRPPSSKVTVNEFCCIRSDIAQTLNFKVDPALLDPGDLAFRVELTVPFGVSTQSAATDSSIYDPNQLYHFSATRGLNIWWMAIDYKLPIVLRFSSPDAKLTQAMMDHAEAFVREAFPVAPATVHFKQVHFGLNPFYTPPTLSTGITPGLHLIDSAALRYVIEWINLWRKNGSPVPDHFVGVFPEDVGGPVGDSDPPIFPYYGDGRAVKIVLKNGDLKIGSGNRDGKTVGHEIGHDLGRRHTGICSDWAIATGTDWTWPDGSIHEPGIHAETVQLIDPRHAEMMSYCDDAQSGGTYTYSADGTADYVSWVSVLTYGELFKALVLPDPAAGKAGPAKPRAAAAADEQILIGGWAQSDGSDGQLDSGYRMPANGAARPSMDGGSHCLHFSGPAGDLSDYCFQLSFDDLETGTTADQRAFAVTAPFPAGTTRVSLMSAGKEIAALNTSSAPPTVTVLSPKAGDRWTGGGARTIAWTAVDPDGHPITSTLLYSSDGGQSWEPLTLNITDSQYTFDPAHIDGGPNVMFRLLATDGLNTTITDIGPINVVQAPAIQFSESTVDFGAAPVGVPATATLTISNTGNGPLSVDSIRPDKSDFIVSAGFAPLVIPAGASRDITLTWMPVSLGGSTAVLTITSNDIARNTWTVNLKGTAVESGLVPGISLSVDPSDILDFGTVNPNQSQSGKITISNSGNGPLSVSALTISGPPFTITSPAVTADSPLSIDAGKSADVTLRFAPGTTGAVSGTLTVASSDPNRHKIAVTLSGTGTGPATGGGAQILEFQRNNAPVTSVDFGAVAPNGPPATVTLQVVNKSSARVMVTNVTFDNAKFAIVGPARPFPIGATSFTNVTLSFAPADTSAQTGTATFTTDDPSHQTATLSLHGSGGVAPPTCTFSLEATKNSVPNISSGVTFNVTASASNCAWTATSNADWIVITTGPRGVGSGTVAYTVSPNPTTSQRIGTLLIAGITYTVTQAGGTTNQPTLTDIVIKNDGSSFTSAEGPPTGKTTESYVVRLTPPAYPATLKNVEIFFGNRGDGLALDAPITVVASTNPLAIPIVDGLQFYTIPYFVNSLGAFNSYIMPPLNINSGDFVVGFSAATAAGIRPMDLDVTSPSAKRSFISTDGRATFTLIDSLGRPANFAIRATVGIPASGPAPVIAVNPLNVTFDNTPILLTGTKQITITNTGNASLNVTGFTTVAPFSVVSPPLPFTVAGNASVIVTLGFTPTAAGPQTAALSIASNDPNSPTVKVSLTGTGQVPTVGGACLVPPSNLVSWWPGDGNANDTTGGNNGTLQSGATFGSGEVGQAFQFDGSSGFVQVGNPANLRLTSAITIDAWINPRGVPAASVGPPMSAIVTKWAQIAGDTADSDSYGLWLLQNGGAITLFSAIHQAGGKEPTVQGGVIPLNTWTHVAMTFDGASGQYVAYINGQAVASVTAPGSVFPTNHNVFIGREDSFVSRAFNGLMDEVDIYNRALSAAEIQAIFNAGAAGKCKPAPAPAGKLDVSPASLDFGSVNVGGPGKDLQLTVKNTGGTALSAIVTSSNPLFSVSPATAFPVAANNSLTVNVHFAPTAAGLQPATLTVATTDGAQSIPVTVSGTGVTAPAAAKLDVSPASLDFASVNVGGPGKDLQLTVKNTGGTALSAMVTSSNPLFSVSPATAFPVAANNSLTVNVHFAPTAAGLQSATLTVATIDGAQSIPVSVSGTGVAPPPAAKIDVSPATLDFGSVNGGEAKDLGVKVNNSTNVGVTIASITSSNPRFYAIRSSTPFSIGGQSFQFITIRFAPLVPGPQTATFTIRASDTGVAPVSVTVTGTGVGAWVSPNSLDFGNVTVNQTGSLFVLVKSNSNDSQTITLTSSNPRFAPSPASFGLSSSQGFSVLFTPKAVGAQAGTLTVTSSDPAVGSFTVSLKGTGN